MLELSKKTCSVHVSEYEHIFLQGFIFLAVFEKAKDDFSYDSYIFR